MKQIPEIVKIFATDKFMKDFYPKETENPCVSTVKTSNSKTLNCTSPKKT